MLTCKQEGGTSLSCHLIFFPPAPDGKGAALFSDADTMIVNESTAHGTKHHHYQRRAMGVTFASDQHQRIVVLGTGYYARRAINGITGPGVSIIARGVVDVAAEMRVSILVENDWKSLLAIRSEHTTRREMAR